VACKRCNWEARQAALSLSGRLATLDGYYRTALVSPSHRNIDIEIAISFLVSAPA